MAKSWLELQENLRTGASSLLNPVESGSCSTGSTGSSGVLDLPDIDISNVNQILGDVQQSIDNFGAEVMGVLQDIGAWIPSELQGGGSSSSEEKKPADFAAVNNYQNVVEAGGNIVTTTGYDDQTGDSFWQIRTSSGSGITLDTDGSCILRGAKNPATDPKTGRVDVITDGGGVIKYGEFLAIEINNDNEVLSATNPSVPGAAFSIIVNGNVDIKATGTLRLGGKNILLQADDSLELKGADIKLHAGGAAGNATGNKKPAEDHGGAIELKAGVLKQNVVSTQKLEGATYTKVSGEKVFAMDDPNGNFGISSAGTMQVKVAGDMQEEIGGRKLTEVFKRSLNIPPLPTLTGISAGYYITNGSPITTTGSSDAADPPPLLEVYGSAQGAGGGLKFSTIRGNIDLSTKVGNFAMSNATGFVADIVEPFKDPTTGTVIKKLVEPGLHLGSIAGRVNVSSGTEVNVFAGKAGIEPVDRFLKISLAGMFLQSKTGIYLN